MQVKMAANCEPCYMYILVLYNSCSVDRKTNLLFVLLIYTVLMGRILIFNQWKNRKSGQI